MCSLLLFIIVLEAILRECKSCPPWEMLYSDDFIIIIEGLEEFGVRCAAWKSCIESKWPRVNLTKTKVMINDVNQGPTFTFGNHTCGVCCKGVGFSSIFCNHCVH